MKSQKQYQANLNLRTLELKIKNIATPLTFIFPNDSLKISSILKACDDNGNYDLTSGSNDELWWIKGKVIEVKFNDCQFIQRTVSFSWQDYAQMGKPRKIVERGRVEYESL